LSYLAERLNELRRHLDHLAELSPHGARSLSAATVRSNLSLANDVAYSLLMVTQRTIDVAAELSTRRGLRFEDFQEAIRNLAIHEEFPDALIRKLEPLPELRNHLIYGQLEPERMVDFLGKLDGVERFAQAVGRMVQKKG
jgi:uncharacterized protein YutE (UPF0331/DUF86 family)